MNKTIKIILLTLFISSCSINQTDSTSVKLERLRAENDSLKEVIADINTKYVFDSIAVRDIPSYQNSYKSNTEVRGEIVFVGYNSNEDSYVIKLDSIERNGSTVLQKDTLKNVDGGYLYQKLLTSDYNTFSADLRTGNKYGKTFEAQFNTSIKADKN